MQYNKYRNGVQIMPEKSLSLSVLPGRFVISKLDPNSDIPNWCTSGAFFSITKTDNELSIVYPQGIHLNDVSRGVSERDWKALRIDGILDFSFIGVIASISNIFANKGISIFVISTFNTDYFLVKEKDLEKATETLIDAGFNIHTFK
ncbi:MAG: amino acid-binding ACT domain-containing protein [Promethearchaeota archaeon CR_4]|nr:MAG: amino acid-binding ACT domain-containing protein [Candidatus Lokiarchaeota archaeon CR_4]